MLISIRKVMQAMQRPIPEDKIVQSNDDDDCDDHPESFHGWNDISIHSESMFCKSHETAKELCQQKWDNDCIT